MYVETLSVSFPEDSFLVPELVQLACSFRSRISFRCNHSNYNAKSIMGMMSMDLRGGTLQISADGDDEKEAVAALKAFLSSDKQPI